MNTMTLPNKLTVGCLRVDWWPRQHSFYVEAFDHAGRNVLAVAWTADGHGAVTLDELSDEESDEVYEAVKAAWITESGRN